MVASTESRPSRVSVAPETSTAKLAGRSMYALAKAVSGRKTKYQQDNQLELQPASRQEIARARSFGQRHRYSAESKHTAIRRACELKNRVDSLRKSGIDFFRPV